MSEKKKFYITITVLISLFLVFGGIQNNFSAESEGISNMSNATGNNSYNNSTATENTTLQIGNNSSNLNQTMINSTEVESQSTTIPNGINTILNLVTANIIQSNTTNAHDPQAAAGDSKKSTTGTVNQTEGLPPITSNLSLKKCLKPTENAQSNNPRIKALAKKITKGATSKYKKAVKLFKWVRDNIGYSFYYNTKYGAVKTLKKKKGNCVDTSHLLVALSRAAGIPARYVHVKAKFPDDKVYGHVFVQVYVKGKWYNVDASSTKNSFDVIKKWDTATAKIKGVYASLPF